MISIDVELAWGTFDHNGHIVYKDAYEKYRLIVARLLELFAKHQVPATWAVVGHLFLDSCKTQNGQLHPDIVRPRYHWFKKDWFSLDPGSDISKDKFWYGSDIVKMIKFAEPQQEIASHSFCHLVFSDPGCSKEAADSDVAKCIELAKMKGVDLKSFIFPRNSPGHLDILSKYGFRVFRGQGDRYCSLRLPRIIEKIYFLLDDMISTTPPVVLPKAISNHGLIEVPASMLFRFAFGKSRFIPEGVRFSKAKKGIDAAIKRRKIFHLWFHPSSFAWKTPLMFFEFEKILEYASKQRSKDILEISTLLKISDMYMHRVADNDKFNLPAVNLHDRRDDIFRKDYSDNLTGYYSNAFKYGRKKIESVLLKFLDNLNNGNRILDIGCGTGYYLNLMSKRGFNCIGIDLSENMLHQLKDAYSGLAVQISDAKRLSFKENSFEAVVSIETLRYFSNRNHLLSEVFRVIRPGGLVFITAAPFFSLNTYGIFNVLCRAFNLKSLVSCFQSFEMAGSLKKRLEKAGFTDVTIKGYFFGPYFLLDKIYPKASSFLMKKFENFDGALTEYNLIKNFSNHLIAIARKPKL